MDKVYDHTQYEDKIYSEWEEKGFFKPEVNRKGQPYTILMPPPNANASLHAGHGMYTIDDVLTRWKRMQGYSALWIPGLDHAGIETQFVYEKELAKTNKSRMDFDRITLYQNIYNFVKTNSGLILRQFKRLGFSADWDRTVFTLDSPVLNQVFSTFQKMVNENLVYRDDHIVNFCPHCGTTLAELEVRHKERTDPLYYIKYGPLTVATVRPETLFGDTAVAVHPQDKRYKNLIGKLVPLPLTNRHIPVIADSIVDPEFGTGAVKITPAHDPNDFETGKRHHLPTISIIDLDGRLSLPQDAEPQSLNGKSVSTARQETIQLLKENHLIQKIDENYFHAVTTCYKCKNDIEPTIHPNWFIRVAPLKPAVTKAIQSGETQLYPARFKKQFLQWMKVMHDWPISRQIAWGIRIPAWYDTHTNPDLAIILLDKNGKQTSGLINDLVKTHTFPEIESGLQSLTAPNTAKYLISPTKPQGQYLQETDTFDTWFSSGQWPLVTLKEKEYSTRFPTDVLGTLSDILPFWVSRMMIFSLYLKNQVPFQHVYLWPMVTDAKGIKMSKSKGNVINPLDLIDKYGADAFRFTLLFGTGQGSKVILSEDKVKGARNFTNKLWNMARFIKLQLEKTPLSHPPLPPQVKLHPEDKRILESTNQLIKEVTSDLEQFHFSYAAQRLYNFAWHTLADQYIEQTKHHPDPSAALSLLLHTYKQLLKLLHPFMPFVTEAIWHELPHTPGDPSHLIIAPWPKPASRTSKRKL